MFRRRRERVAPGRRFQQHVPVHRSTQRTNHLIGTRLQRSAQRPNHLVGASLAIPRSLTQTLPRKPCIQRTTIEESGTTERIQIPHTFTFWGRLWGRPWGRPWIKLPHGGDWLGTDWRSWG